MSLDGLEVRVRRGGGLVQRVGDGVLVLPSKRSGAAVGELLAILRASCDEGSEDCGRQFTRRVVQHLKGPERDMMPTFSTIAWTNGGIAVVLHGDVELRVRRGGNEERHSARREPTWVDVFVELPIESLIVAPDGADADLRDFRAHLDEGTVRGSMVAISEARSRPDVAPEDSVSLDPSTLDIEVEGELELLTIPEPPEEPEEPPAGTPHGTLGDLVVDDQVTYRLDADYVVGREPEEAEEVQLGMWRPLKLDDPYVSAVHAIVRRVGGAVTVTDLGSTNGTVVRYADESEASRLDADKPLTISAGAQIEVGKRVITYARSGNPARDGTETHR